MTGAISKPLNRLSRFLGTHELTHTHTHIHNYRILIVVSMKRCDLRLTARRNYAIFPCRCEKLQGRGVAHRHIRMPLAFLRECISFPLSCTVLPAVVVLANRLPTGGRAIRSEERNERGTILGHACTAMRVLLRDRLVTWLVTYFKA